MGMFEQVLGYLTLGIGIVGIIVILWGILSGLFRFVQLEYQKVKGKNICKNREILRQHIGSYLLLGLEFLIAADVIHTITKPSLKEMAILGSIVGIRTILNFFLNKELEGHNCIEN
jgi:uncharacterized membrane protein